MQSDVLIAKVNLAKVLGAAAFEAGIPCAPIKDDEIMAMVGPGRPDDDKTTILEGWHYGWHKANVTALVDTALADNNEQAQWLLDDYDALYDREASLDKTDREFTRPWREADVTC